MFFLQSLKCQQEIFSTAYTAILIIDFQGMDKLLMEGTVELFCPLLKWGLLPLGAKSFLLE